jgi:hypothetical protein
MKTYTSPSSPVPGHQKMYGQGFKGKQKVVASAHLAQIADLFRVVADAKSTKRSFGIGPIDRLSILKGLHPYADTCSVRIPCRIVPNKMVLNASISWLLEFRKSLWRMQSLVDNWNSLGSAAPNQLSMHTTNRVLDVLYDMEVDPSAIAPSAEEGVGISFVKGEKHAILECYNDGSILAATYKDAGEPDIWDVGSSESEIKEAVEKISSFIES